MSSEHKLKNTIKQTWCRSTTPRKIFWFTSVPLLSVLTLRLRGTLPVLGLIVIISAVIFYVFGYLPNARPKLKHFIKILLIVSSPLIIFYGLLITVGILGTIGRPYVKITDVRWSQDTNMLIIDAHLARCSEPCRNIGIEVNDTIHKRIVPSKEDGSFQVIIPKNEVTTKYIKVGAYLYADYHGGQLHGDRVKVPDTR